MANPTPPYPIPAGQVVGWAFPTASFGTGVQTQMDCSSIYTGLLTASAEATNLGGQVLLSGACTLTGFPDPEPYCKWSGFQIPFLPSGTAVKAIYPVVFATGESADAYHSMSYGLGSTVSGTVGIPGGSYSGQYAGPSIGASLADVEDAFVEFSITQTLSGGGWPDKSSISFVALAVYMSVSGVQPSVVTVSVGNTRPLPV